MAEVVGETDRLHQILVDIQGAGDGPRDLGYLQRVRQPGPVQIPLVVDEDLCLVNEPPERGAVDDPVPVPLELAPVRWGGLGDPPTGGSLLRGGVGLQSR